MFDSKVKFLLMLVYLLYFMKLFMSSAFSNTLVKLIVNSPFGPSGLAG
jgi:hypothetical protein